MQLSLRDNLPFVTVTIAYSGHTIEAKQVLVDTGSATTILAADVVAKIQVVPSPDDELHIIRGIGGSEVVFSRVVDYLQIGENRLPKFEVEVGGMDYGFRIDGILGMDLLTQMGAIINLREMQLSFES
jgi:predicted aspartyl protease